MAEIVLPPIQMGPEAWENVAIALREYADTLSPEDLWAGIERSRHLVACAEAIEVQMRRLTNEFDAASGSVKFRITATLSPGVEAA